MRVVPLVLIGLLIAAHPILAQSVLASQTLGAGKESALKLGVPGQEKSGIPSLPTQWKDCPPPWKLEDQNADGSYDYAIKRDKKLRNEAEAYDFNFDGQFDDFYLYDEGVLVRREVDSNFDGLIDLWVYLKNGSYIRGFEKDSDFDGILDKVKLY